MTKILSILLLLPAFCQAQHQTTTQGITRGAADARYVNTSGDTMTGNLTMPNGYVTSVFQVGTAVAGSTAAISANGLLLEGAAAGFPPSSFNGNAFIMKTAGGGPAPFDNAGSIFYRPRVSSTANRSDHIFYTGDPSLERVRISADGKVGIGTAVPAGLLSVEGPAPSANGLVNIYNTAIGDTVYSIKLNSQDNGGNAVGIFRNNNLLGVINTENSAFNFGSNGKDIYFSTATKTATSNTALTIKTVTGNIGIGKTDPGSQLTILDPGGDAVEVRESDDGNSALKILSANTGSAIYGYKSGSQTLQILSSNDIGSGVNYINSGSVGIGTITPVGLLQIGNSAANTTVTIQGASASILSLVSNNSIVKGSLEYSSAASGDLILKNNATGDAASIRFQTKVGSGAIESLVVTGSGVVRPYVRTLAEIQAIIPGTAGVGGIISCSNCSAPYSVCVATSATVNTFTLLNTTAACN